MPDIVHDFPIVGSAEKVFQAIASPAGLDVWWTKKSSGTREIGSEYTLWFGPEYDWRAVVTKCETNKSFELKMTRADNDWMSTIIGFVLEEKSGNTRIRFYHTGWPEANEHYRISCFCWAMYLRLLKRYVEFGEIVPYENRLDV